MKARTKINYVVCLVFLGLIILELLIISGCQHQAWYNVKEEDPAKSHTVIDQHSISSVEWSGKSKIFTPPSNDLFCFL